MKKKCKRIALKFNYRFTPISALPLIFKLKVTNTSQSDKRLNAYQLCFEHIMNS